MTQAEAYIAGWNAVMNGADARYGMIFAQEHANSDPQISYAWTHGALDAMEAEDGEQPEPSCVGYK
jgi:hypothetical protein